jgi:uncharacterized membrane protein
MPAAKKESRNIFLRMHPLQRILMSMTVAFIVFWLTRQAHFSPLLCIMVLWDVFAISYIATSIVVLLTRTVGQIREFARREDGSRIFVFFMILLSSLASMVMVLLLIISRDKATTERGIFLPAAIGGMLLSWMMVHIMFAFHYAHRYYDDDEEAGPQKHAGGLNFPEEKKPDYPDFLYFSFVVGMTFQVSDVEITSRRIRRIVLAHGLLSFLLNTFVVALTINIIAGLKH